MSRLIVAILCTTLTTAVTTKNKSQSSTLQFVTCPSGAVVLQGKYLQVSNTCKSCFVCQTGNDSQYNYIFCPPNAKLHDCDQEMFLHLWSSEAMKGVRIKPREGHDKEKKLQDDKVVPTTTGKTVTLIPNGYIPLPLGLGFIGICLAIILMTVFAIFVFFRKKKKQQQSSYDAISSRRRQHQYIDENYIRYTKDPTSAASRSKDRMRASWPRAARSENRYLLEVVSREPDTASTSREDNPDSNSAQYVFIQTFSASAAPGSSSAAPGSSPAAPGSSRSTGSHDIHICDNGENSGVVATGGPTIV